MWLGQYKGFCHTFWKFNSFSVVHHSSKNRIVAISGFRES